MNQKVRTMLKDVYSQIDRKFNNSLESWDRFIELLAVDRYAPIMYQLDHKFEWLFENPGLAKSLRASYDINLLISDFYDHLGEMYLEMIDSNKEMDKKGLYSTPSTVAKPMAAMTIKNTNKPIKILDPAVGTGRLLMAAYKQAPNAVFFGVDSEIRLLRIAYTNFLIHDIKGYLLHANRLEHEIDISTEAGKYNWQYANEWNSHITELKLLEAKESRKNDQITMFNGK